MDLSRRDFLASSTAAAATGALAGSAQAQTPTLVAQAVGAPAPRGFDPADPALKYELVIANGDVLDPSQKLRGKRDIGIRYGQIAAIAPSIPPDRAVQRIDVAGRLVTPGLVDLHTHLCPHLGLGLPADEMVGITCTTTAVSAGDAGWHTWGVFRHLALANRGRGSSRSCTSRPSDWPAASRPARCWNIDYANVDGCAKIVSENPDVVLGVKVRITDSVVGQNGLEPLRRALRAAELAGKACA
jgi:dihydroorotase